MKNFIIAIIVIIIIISLFQPSHEHFCQYQKINLLGPSINSQLSNNKLNMYNSDPNQFFENNGFLISIPYQNLIKNSFTNNIKKSLALACIREIFNDTKLILNENKKPISFNYTNITELQPILNDYKPILNLIFNTVNTVAKKYFLIKPQKLNSFKLFQSNNKFLFDIVIMSHVTNYDDDINSQKEVFKNNLDFDKIQQMDTMTQKNPFLIKTIIQFIITKNKEEIDIYIYNLSAIKDTIDVNDESNI
jgi:hypothetical protein